MASTRLSRREFAQSLATTAAAAMVAPRLLTSDASARSLPEGMPETTIQLNANENPYGPSPAAKQAITGAEQVASRYPDGLRDQAIETIARLHNVPREYVALGCGSSQILEAADLCFLKPARTLVVAEPTYEAVLEFCNVLHSPSVKVPLTADHRLDLPKMAAACDANTGLVYVVNPNNPTGAIVTKKELEDFMPRVPQTAVVLVDEAYFHFVEDPGYASVVPWTKQYPNLVVTWTFSKIYGMAGMRLGYAIAQPKLSESLRKRVSYACANAAVLRAALASLGDAELVPRERKRLNDSRRWLVSEMKRQGREVIPSETNFVMIQMNRDVTPVIKQFRERGILVGRKFPSMPTYLRVSIGTPSELQAFSSALQQIVPAKG
ncbi:MAG TPA: aminotransferase class I/II-fold pyridoxal phosphate-dependent enzyme [Candidatus Acidoferrales bacterium]|nr:aminotransferase class I/II-fold pyridoxal phosphate-dependent enzyme [Candidatus Acidoferrales bacterium]